MKPHVTGLRDPKGGWFYIAQCDRCEWSCGWDGALPWDRLVEAAEMHWWMYADTPNCRSGA